MMTSKFTLGTLVVLVAAAILKPVEGVAHARLKQNANIVPRSTDSGIKDPNGPCGPNPRLTPREFAPGSSISVDWEETINHPGQFEFYLSQGNDQNFQLLKIVPDDQDTAISGTAYHQFTTTITFPAGVTCNACTLQMIQLMTDRNPPTKYFNCADVKLTANPQPNPNPVPVPSPTPTPTPLPNPSPTSSPSSDASSNNHCP